MVLFLIKLNKKILLIIKKSLFSATNGIKYSWSTSPKVKSKWVAHPPVTWWWRLSRTSWRKKTSFTALGTLHRQADSTIRKTWNFTLATNIQVSLCKKYCILIKYNFVQDSFIQYVKLLFLFCIHLSFTYNNSVKVVELRKLIN